MSPQDAATLEEIARAADASSQIAGSIRNTEMRHLRKDDYEDYLQEVFVEVKGARANPAECPDARLRRVANTVRKRFSRSKCHKPLESLSERSGAPLTRGVLGPIEAAQFAELLEWLPELGRQLVLRLIEGHRIKDLPGLLGISRYGVYELLDGIKTDIPAFLGAEVGIANQRACGG